MKKEIQTKIKQIKEKIICKGNAREEKNIKSILNRYVNSIAFPITIGIIIILKTILFYQNTILIRENIDKDTVIGTIAFVSTIICIICTLPNRARIITTILTDILLSLLLFADNLYYTYSSSVISVSQIINIQYGEEIINTIPMLLQLKEILYFIDIFIIIGLISLKIVKIKKKEKINNKKKIIKTVVGILAIIIFFTIDNKFIQKAKEHPYNKDAQIKLSTIYGYHISDIENTVNIKKQAKYTNKDLMLKDYEELKNFYKEKYGKTNYDLQGIAEGKNVIILQLESIQEFVINKKINGKEITPNLNKFINENIEISNMYMQSYSSTADSEFSSITSLYPMENGMSYSRYHSNIYDNIFKMFKDKEYTTSFIHGNYGFFWNRENVYKAFKVDNIELREQFEDKSEEIMGYISDELVYKQAVEKFKKYQKPFFSYIVSASSHTGFTLDGLQDKNKVNINVGKYKNTFLGNYLESVNYADYAFGKFIEELKKANLYDDTVILLYGDHNGIDMYNEELQEFLKATQENLNDVDIKLNYIRVACGIKIPGINNIKIEKPVNKLDIKPTIAYLINGNPGISLGTNMFAQKNFISLNNERIVTNRYYFDEKWYDIQKGEEVNLEKISNEEKNLLKQYYDNMKKELDISNSITINNLLK